MTEAERFCPACGAPVRSGVPTAPPPPQPAVPVPQPFPGEEELALVSRMNDLQRSLYNTKRKDPTAALLFCLFLGSFGVHHFYLGKPVLGILYAVFCWTMIPALISLIELFFITGRTREYNVMVAHQILQYGAAAAVYA